MYFGQRHEFHALFIMLPKVDYVRITSLFVCPFIPDSEVAAIHKTGSKTKQL